MPTLNADKRGGMSPLAGVVNLSMAVPAQAEWGDRGAGDRNEGEAPLSGSCAAYCPRGGHLGYRVP